MERFSKAIPYEPTLLASEPDDTKASVPSIRILEEATFGLENFPKLRISPDTRDRIFLVGPLLLLFPHRSVILLLSKLTVDSLNCHLLLLGRGDDVDDIDDAVATISMIKNLDLEVDEMNIEERPPETASPICLTGCSRGVSVNLSLTDTTRSLIPA